MKTSTLASEYPHDRELLEALALDEVCACLYYELCDYLGITSDLELIRIIKNHHQCVSCYAARKAGN
jgi:hypothetical protein